MAIVIVTAELWEQIKDKPNPLLLPNWELEHHEYCNPVREVFIIETPIEGFREYEEAVPVYTREKDGSYRLLSINHVPQLEKVEKIRFVESHFSKEITEQINETFQQGDKLKNLIKKLQKKTKC